MKKLIFFIIAVLPVIAGFAQAPQSFSYQAVARDLSGNVLAGKVVSFRISILSGSATGTVVYSESHSASTNEYGLVELQIGKGTPVTGSFSSISWGSAALYLKTEMDPAGGTAWQNLGTSQLLSVPYALFAKDVQNNNDADADPANELQKISLKDNTLTLDKSGGSVTLPPPGILTETDPTWNGEANEVANIGRNGRVGIGTTTPAALLHINGTGIGEGNVLFTGQIKNSGPGNPPATGAGTRMMWYPDKAAFRCGGLVTTQVMNFWDKDSIGLYSFSAGSGVMAKGDFAASFGEYSEANGKCSFAAGYDANAFGEGSVAIGYQVNAKEKWTLAMGSGSAATGMYSTAIGMGAKAYGNWSTAIGQGARAYSWGETAMGSYNSTYTPESVTERKENDRLFVIGNGIIAKFSNAFTILKNGNTGIGDDTPAEKLHISNKSGTVKMRMQSTDHNAIEFWDNTSFRGSVGFSTTQGHLYLYNGGSVALKEGKLGIGTIDPTNTLDVVGNARIRSIASGAYYGVVNRTSDGTLTTATSDMRMKENIRTLQGGLDKVMQLRGVTFTWKTNPEYGTRIGFIAQEMEQVIPELVFTNPADGYKGVNYAEMNAVLVEAIKEQQELIEGLKEENNNLTSEITLMKNKSDMQNRYIELVSTRVEKLEVMLMKLAQMSE